MSTKVHYLNSHLHKFREKNKITIDVENIGDLAHYSNLYEEDKKTTKIFTECFKNKESYKELLKKLPKNIERLGIYYLITVYWINYNDEHRSTNVSHKELFDWFKIDQAEFDKKFVRASDLEE